MKRALPFLIVVAAFAAGCDHPIEIHSPDTASAPPAPSLADTPFDATKPATHDGAPQADDSAATTARDTKANAPAETLTRAKESSQMPLAGQANNHSSPAFEKGSGAGG
jgi:hypothetical protein